MRFIAHETEVLKLAALVPAVSSLESNTFPFALWAWRINRCAPPPTLAFGVVGLVAAALVRSLLVLILASAFLSSFADLSSGRIDLYLRFVQETTFRFVVTFAIFDKVLTEIEGGI